MGTPLSDKVITRGMGPARKTPETASLITMGFGPIEVIIVVVTTPEENIKWLAWARLRNVCDPSPAQLLASAQASCDCHGVKVMTAIPAPLVTGNVPWNRLRNIVRRRGR
jgi:hypothetical protein